MEVLDEVVSCGRGRVVEPGSGVRVEAPAGDDPDLLRLPGRLIFVEGELERCDRINRLRVRGPEMNGTCATTAFTRLSIAAISSRFMYSSDSLEVVCLAVWCRTHPSYEKRHRPS